MKSWFGRRAVVGPAGATQAYREGRQDERVAEARTARAVGPRRTVVVRRRGLPLLSFLVLVVVVFGAVMLYLAAQNGSFSRGGAVIDHDLSQATQPVRRAEGQTGAALQRAGQHLQQAAGAPASQ